MKLRIAIAAAAVLSAWPVAVWAAPDGEIRASMAVCDPNNPRNCLAPNASGGLPGSSSGGSSGPATGTGGYSAQSVSTSSTQVLAAAASGRAFLDLKNESTSQPIACSFGGTAALNTAGSFTIAAGGDARWEGSFVPSDQVNCITSTGSAPLTIGVH